MPTIKDAYIFAIINEIKSQNLYNLMSIASRNQTSKSIFDELKKIEKIHEEKVTKLFHQQFPGEELETDRSALPRLKRDEKIKDPREALLFAIEREQMASNNYKELMNHAEKPEIRKIFSQLAKEEEQHEELLETELSRMSGAMLWFDESELSGLFEY